jgi:hypothetical protein
MGMINSIILPLLAIELDNPKEQIEILKKQVRLYFLIEGSFMLAITVLTLLFWRIPSIDQKKKKSKKKEKVKYEDPTKKSLKNLPIWPQTKEILSRGYIFLILINYGISLGVCRALLNILTPMMIAFGYNQVTPP